MQPRREKTNKALSGYQQGVWHVLHAPKQTPQARAAGIEGC